MPDHYASFASVKCTTTSGYTWTTSINPACTQEEAERYFLYHYVDVGVYPEERLEEVVKVEYTPAPEAV